MTQKKSHEAGLQPSSDLSRSTDSASPSDMHTPLAQDRDNVLFQSRQVTLNEAT